MSMFIAIATDDFLNFTDNNEAETYNEFTKNTEYPIFTGVTINEARKRVENFFRIYFNIDEDIPEYEICEITTEATIKGVYELTIKCSYAND